MMLKNSNSINIWSDKIRWFKLALLGVSGSIPGVGSLKLADIEFVYSGRKGGLHRQGVRLMMNKEAAKSCLCWEGMNIESSLVIS